MSNYNNRFLNEKDKNKRKNEASSFYSDQITSMMKEKLAWTPQDYGKTDTGYGSITASQKADPPSRTIIQKQPQYEVEQQPYKKNVQTFSKEKEAEIRKKSSNPFIRMGKHDLNTYEEDKVAREKKYNEKYPIIRQTRKLINNPVTNNTIKPMTEGVLKAAGDTVGELATIGNKEAKANLRNYLDEREAVQKGVGKAAYKVGEVGTNLALMSSISNKIPFIKKLDTVTKSKLVNTALREGVENVVMGAGTDLIRGDTEDFAKNRLKDFGSGAAFGVGMEGLSRVGKKIASKIARPQDIPYNPRMAKEAIEDTMDINPKEDLNSTMANLEENKAIPNIPSKKGYEINNPNGKMKPHIVGGNLKETDLIPDERKFEALGNRKVKAMGYEHSELRPYIESEAYALKGELERTVKASHGQIKNDSGTILKGFNNSRITSPDIGNLKDLTGASYKQLDKAINDVIEDNGKENYALAKRVEKVIDERLTKGYDDDIYGEFISPHNGYISAKNEIYGEPQNYSKIPKMAEREKILKRFNEEYGNYPRSEAQTPLNADTQVNTPQEFKASQNLNSERIEEVKNSPQPMKYENINTGKPEIAMTQLGDTAVSKMKTNTYTNSPFMDDEQTQKVVKSISGEYEVLHNKDLIESAKMELEEDFGKTVENLINKSNNIEHGLMDSKDIVQASMITNKLIEESKTTGDTENLKEFLKKIRLEATSLGQAVQSISTWKKQTPEGMLLKAQGTVDNVLNDMRKNNPKKVEIAENMVDEAKKIADDILSGKTTVVEGTKGKNNIIKKTIEEAAKNNELDKITKMAEKILDKNGIPSLTDDDIKIITEKMGKIETMKNGREKDVEFALVKKLIADKIPPTTTDKILAAQRINLLLNPKTNIRNFLGNIPMAVTENVKDIVGTPIDKAISLVTNERTTTIPSIKAQYEGFIKGFKEGVEDSKLGIDTTKGGGRYDLPSSQAFRKIDNPKTVSDMLNNVASKSEKLTHTLLSIGDRPYFEAAFSGSIDKQLRLNKGISEPTEEMIEKAVKEAEDRTFQNTNKMVEGFKSFQKGLNKMSSKVTGTDEFGLGNLVMPFTKTPSNILDKAIDYSPIGGIEGLGKLISGLHKGTLNQSEVVDKLGRSVVGSSIIYAGYKMAKEGVLYGAGAKDKDAKALEQQTGRLPYSIKNGNTYTTIDWVQPAAIPLMIGADIFEQKKTDKEAKNVILNAIKSGGATLFNQSLLQGMSDLFGGYGYNAGENIMEGVKKTAISGTGQFIPYNSLLNQVTKLTDKNVRTYYDESDIKSQIKNFQSKIPTQSNKLPKKIDTVGNEVKQSNGTKGARYLFDTFINPARQGKYKPTKAEKLALDIYDRTGETIQIPRVAPKNFIYSTDEGKVNHKLTGKEISELQEIMGKKTEEAFNKKAEEIKFQNMDDFEKAKVLQKLMTEITKEAKEDFINKKQKNKK